jgi:beta-glucosidase
MLRTELGFEGVILTDIKDILKLVEMHKAVPTVEEAVILSLNAGIDMSMSCNDVEFAKIVLEKVKDGTISESRIDESVRRILNMKFELGLFDNPFPEDNIFDTEESLNEHRDLAFEAAVKSQVLLKNDGILPLSKQSNVLLTGFAAHSKRNLNGAWTFEWLGADEDRQPDDMRTIRDVMDSEWEGELNYLDPGELKFKESFLQEAKNSDYIILTIGEEPYSEFKGDINDMRMPADCRQLCELAFSTDKPVVLLLVQGRPRLLEDIDEYVGAIIFTGYPGIKGAEAITALLTGEKNFSGKLAFSYPGDMANFSPYNSKITRDYEPLFEFGHGLSYTEYQYSELVLSDSLSRENEAVKASVSITNSGDLAGDEIVLFFVQDMHGKITRPKKELLGFKRVSLEPGETKKITFSLNPQEDLSYPNAEGEYVLEKGHFRVLCGDEEAYFEVK